jgi:serine protease AprX
MERRRAVLATSWNDSKKEKKGKLGHLLLASALSLAFLSPPMRASMSEAMHDMVSVIVRAVPGDGPQVRHAIESFGGHIDRRIRIIRGFSARVPAHALDDLATNPAVMTISPDRRIQMMGLLDPVTDVVDTAGDTLTGGDPQPTTEPSPTPTTEPSPTPTSAPSPSPTTQPSPTPTTAPAPTYPAYDPIADATSMYNTSRAIRANDYWKNGYTGEGVDVAVIDTGVVPVEGLDEPDQVVNGPDLSFESQIPELSYLDTYGHGTHIAGIIAGRDDSVAVGGESSNTTGFMGVAPDARIVNVKVADHEGAVDVSQVIAAIDWVVHHRRDPGMNIRVLNLSFGTDGVQDYVLDPLTYAAEVAWHKGIVVVAAAGNTGFGSPALSNPAYDPYIISVGADMPNGIGTTKDDVIPDWSSRGDAKRHPDFIAPGKSLQSLRNPGSYVDDMYPQGVINERYFRGSGTSQSAAVVSGAVALLLEQRPNLTPDQVKALLRGTAVPLPGQDLAAQGAGLINLRNAYGAPTPNAVQSFPRATGLGTLEGSRGTLHLIDEDGNELRGEIDIFGNAWDPARWSASSMTGTAWSEGFWRGVEWTGGGWTGKSWAGKSWAGKSWAGKSWAGKSWAADTWTGKSWAGKSWAGKSWAGKSWAGAAWTGKAWGGKSWASIGWG